MTESSARLSATAQAYDAVAPAYAELVRDELAALPLDRAVLAAFADYVRAGDGAANGTRRVVELGCGPGRIAAYLHRLELEVSGIDLSPVGRMLREPRDQERFRRGHLLLRSQ